MRIFKDVEAQAAWARAKKTSYLVFSECSEHLKFSISKENVVEIIRAAYLLDADDLFRKAVLAIKKVDPKGVKEDLEQEVEQDLEQELDVLYKEYPKISQKIANYLLFDANWKKWIWILLFLYRNSICLFLWIGMKINFKINQKNSICALVRLRY